MISPTNVLQTVLALTSQSDSFLSNTAMAWATAALAVAGGTAVVASRKQMRKQRWRMSWQLFKLAIAGRRLADRTATGTILLIILAILLGAMLITWAGWWGVAGALVILLLLLLLIRRRNPYRRRW